MSDAPTSSGRRARGGGGAARRAERTAVSIETAKYIERNVPNYEVLTEEALQTIETNAETVLAEIGVNFVDNPAALDRWRAAGAQIDGERVRIPRRSLRNTRETLREMLKLAAIHWCLPLSMARHLCGMPKAGGVMRQSRISKNS